MWLLEKLQLLSKPKASPYKASDYPGRTFIERFHKEEDWLQWLKSLDAESIAWRCPDWTLPRSMMVANMNLGYVVIMGLTKSTFYIPQRFNRQYALDQIELLAEMIIPRTDVITTHSLNIYSGSWRMRCKMIALPKFKKRTTRSYKKWLTKDIEKRARRKLKRKRT